MYGATARLCGKVNRTERKADTLGAGYPEILYYLRRNKQPYRTDLVITETTQVADMKHAGRNLRAIVIKVKSET